MPGERDDGDDDGPLGAAWGGGESEDSGGPPPRPEDVADDPVDAPGPDDVEDWDDVAAYEESSESFDDPDVLEPGPDDVSMLDRITVFLQRHRTAFTIALFAYAFLLFPWLNENGLRAVGIAVGAAFLGGIVLITVANAQEARETLGNDDEERGF